jgi:hypothetical protein
MAEKDYERGSMTVQEAGRKGGLEVQRQRDLRDRKEIMDDPYNKPGPAKGEAYGIAAITQALHGLDFPATKDDLLEHVGNQEIEYRKGQPVSLRRIIEDAPEDDYPSMANVVEAVSEALHEEGLTH